MSETSYKISVPVYSTSNAIIDLTSNVAKMKANTLTFSVQVVALETTCRHKYCREHKIFKNHHCKNMKECLAWFYWWAFHVVTKITGVVLKFWSIESR